MSGFPLSGNAHSLDVLGPEEAKGRGIFIIIILLPEFKKDLKHHLGDARGLSLRGALFPELGLGFGSHSF